MLITVRVYRVKCKSVGEFNLKYVNQELFNSPRRFDVTHFESYPEGVYLSM